MGGSPEVGPEVGYVLKRLRPTTPAFDRLKDESRLEGYWMLVRLADGWASGGNKFRKRGEALFGAWHGRELAGVCGLNIDPYVESRDQGRVRHLFVSAPHRRAGLGRMLVETVIDRARRYFAVLNTRAPPEAFGFYERLGFQPVLGEEFVTHRMSFEKGAEMSLRPPSHLAGASAAEAAFDALGHEILAEKAAALGRAGQRVEETLARLRANADEQLRPKLLKAAAEAVHGYFIQRELCGLRKHDGVIREYDIPRAVLVRLGAK